MQFIHASLIATSIAISYAAHADTQRITAYTGMLQKPAASAAQANITGSFIDQHLSERMALVKFAKTLIGTPYRYGGTTNEGFDCSGLVRFVFAEIGHDLPRISSAQYQSLTPVAQPQIGDLVFFGRRGHVTHVGIYVGDGKMLHAPSSGKTVSIDHYTTGYWGKRYLGARTVMQSNDQRYATQTTTNNDGAKKHF